MPIIFGVYSKIDVPFVSEIKGLMIWVVSSGLVIVRVDVKLSLDVGGGGVINIFMSNGPPKLKGLVGTLMVAVV